VCVAYRVHSNRQKLSWCSLSSDEGKVNKIKNKNKINTLGLPVHNNLSEGAHSSVLSKLFFSLKHLQILQNLSHTLKHRH